jgi:hypothetical protein
MRQGIDSVIDQARRAGLVDHRTDSMCHYIEVHHDEASKFANMCDEKKNPHHKLTPEEIAFYHDILTKPVIEQPTMPTVSPSSMPKPAVPQNKSWRRYILTPALFEDERGDDGFRQQTEALLLDIMNKPNS